MAESKFLEITGDLLKKKWAKEECNEFPKWMISRLQNKVLNLIISLMEGREISDSNPILRRLMRNVTINVLENQISKIYKKFKKLYNDDYRLDCLEHMIKDPRELNSANLKSDKYYSFILQNGFLIFFLIQYYISCEKNLESPVVIMNRTYIKNILKQQSELNYIKGSVLESIF